MLFSQKATFAKFGNFFIFPVPSLTLGPRNRGRVMEMVSSSFIERVRLGLKLYGREGMYRTWKY
jgi:hypothetical protein